jgi:hypothetical protein
LRKVESSTLKECGEKAREALHPITKTNFGQINFRAIIASVGS